ncbi:hypothetical protein M0802_006552 [Mischocyttarus mexicanus]|nr:hypothetical protein M0802_006552 [Mischocyttarus mexicanus]
MLLIIDTNSNASSYGIVCNLMTLRDTYQVLESNVIYPNDRLQCSHGIYEPNACRRRGNEYQDEEKEHKSLGTRLKDTYP